MSSVQVANVVIALRARCEQNIRQGGTGYVSTSALRFDVGLRTSALRRVLDAAVREGSIERVTALRADGHPGGYAYRAVQ